jgi:hypothetical protein
MTTVSTLVSFAVVAVATLAAGSVAADSSVQRSAQSDCQRELQRRGYAVLATRNYQQFRDGWSLELQARDYKGRTSWGTCYVETRTGDVSLYGFGWGGGTGPGAGGVQFNCASPDYKYRECQLPVDGQARLVKRKSDAPCNEGRDWGQRGDRVWVNNGCRASFEVVRGGGGWGGGNPGQQQRAEEHCRKQASREGVNVNSAEPAVSRGQYWETMVVGNRNGRYVKAICRYYPSGNRPELYFASGY